MSDKAMPMELAKTLMTPKQYAAWERQEETRPESFGRSLFGKTPAEKEIEEAMAEIVDLLAADPNLKPSREAWARLLTYAPSTLRLKKRPAAFRYKSEADQWIYTENESRDTARSIRRLPSSVCARR